MDTRNAVDEEPVETIDGAKFRHRTFCNGSNRDIYPHPLPLPARGRGAQLVTRPSSGPAARRDCLAAAHLLLGREQEFFDRANGLGGGFGAGAAASAASEFAFGLAEKVFQRIRRNINTPVTTTRWASAEYIHLML